MPAKHIQEIDHPQITATAVPEIIPITVRYQEYFRFEGLCSESKTKIPPSKNPKQAKLPNSLMFVARLPPSNKN